MEFWVSVKECVGVCGFPQAESNARKNLRIWFAVAVSYAANVPAPKHLNTTYQYCHQKFVLNCWQLVG